MSRTLGAFVPVARAGIAAAIATPNLRGPSCVITNARPTRGTRRTLGAAQAVLAEACDPGTGATPTGATPWPSR